MPRDLVVFKATLPNPPIPQFPIPAPLPDRGKTPLEYGKPFTKRYKIMTVAYPRKFKKTMSARDIMKRVISDREIHRKFGSETPSFYDGFTVKYEHRLRNIC